MFFEQLKQLCAEKGTTPTALVKKAGFSSAVVTSWKNGASPKLDMVEKLAAGLGVPVGAFFGDNHSKPEAPRYSEDEVELIEIYRNLEHSGRRRLFGKAYELLDAQDALRSGEGEISPPDIGLASAIRRDNVASASKKG